jgi:response regulator of citrate/malate metabolism
MEATRGTYLCWADEQNSEAADWVSATADNDIGTVRDAIAAGLYGWT